MLGSCSKSCYRGLLERARQQYYSCYTRRWFQAIPVIDVEPLVKRQQVRAKSQLLQSMLQKLQKLQVHKHMCVLCRMLSMLLNNFTRLVTKSAFSTYVAQSQLVVILWPECPVKTLNIRMKRAGCQPWSTTTDLPECLERGPCLVCSAGIHHDALLYD